MRNKDAFMARGMKRMRESYDAFEQAMSEPEKAEVHGSESSVNEKMRVGNGGNNNAGSSGYEADVEPSAEPTAAPAAEPGPYTGWVHGGNYA